MKEHLIEVKIVNDDYIKYVSILKKFTGESIGEIKKKIQNNEAVIICPYIKEPEKLERLYLILQEMIEMEAEIKIIENARGEIIQEINIEDIKNLIDRHEDILEDEERMIDLELEENLSE